MHTPRADASPLPTGAVCSVVRDLLGWLGSGEGTARRYLAQGQCNCLAKNARNTNPRKTQIMGMGIYLSADITWVLFN